MFNMKYIHTYNFQNCIVKRGDEKRKAILNTLIYLGNVWLRLNYRSKENRCCFTRSGFRLYFPYVD